MFKRTLNLSEFLRETDLLLLGPRQTGKSTLIEQSFAGSVVFDLLNPELFRDLQKNPNLLKELVLSHNKKVIVVDEIQKIPELLDVVQSILGKKTSNKFILTGSSARKLKKQGQNLLGGRVYPTYLHPITSAEYLTGEQGQDLHRLIEVGGLPQVLNSKFPQRMLKAYVGIYLQEEIKAEGYARNLGDFSRFMDVAALTNGEQIDYTGIGQDVQLSPRTVGAYYQILQDTLIGYLLESFKETKSRKAVITPKFYFFDVGVSNFLSGREKLSPGTSEYGRALEHFIFTEILAYKNYSEKMFQIYYWRSTSQFEVDFVIKTKSKKLIGIEVKGSSRIDKHDLKGLKAFEDDFKLERKIIVSTEKFKRRIDGGYEVLPYTEFCRLLWANELI